MLFSSDNNLTTSIQFMKKQNKKKKLYHFKNSINILFDHLQNILHFTLK